MRITLLLVPNQHPCSSKWPDDAAREVLRSFILLCDIYTRVHCFWLNLTVPYLSLLYKNMHYAVWIISVKG